jgi:hypothetical protein
MQGVITRSLAGLGLAAVLTVTAGGAVAVFAAGGPGENLSPADGAELLVDLTQVNGSLLWSSLGGPVSLVETRGWPSDDGTHQLGGGLVIERPANELAGTVDIGEPPMSVTFGLSDS